MNYDVIVFGDSHIGPVIHVKNVMPDVFSDRFLLSAAFCWADNGMIAYEFTSKTQDAEVVFNPIMEMHFEKYRIYDRFYKEWSKKKLNLVFMTGFVESQILSWKTEWAGYALASESGKVDDQIIDLNLLRAFISKRLSAYFDGLQLLCARGFNVYQLAGPPPYREINGLVLSPQDRLIVFDLIVELFEVQAKRIGFRFLKSDFLAGPDGFLRPEFEIDSVHVNAEGGVAILDFLNDQLSDLKHPGEPAQIGFPTLVNYLGEGWHTVEAWGCWSSKRRARVIFNIPDGCQVTGVNLSLVGPVCDVMPSQTAVIVLNKLEVGSVSITASMDGLFRIDRRLLVDGRNDIEIFCAKLVRPNEVDPQSCDYRSLGIGLKSIEFEADQ